jgi:hypothetical protein
MVAPCFEGSHRPRKRFARFARRVHNFIEFIASGRATPALAEALAQAEEQVKALKADVASMELAGREAFTPPPRAWIADRIGRLNALLAERTSSRLWRCAG